MLTVCNRTLSRVFVFKVAHGMSGNWYCRLSRVHQFETAFRPLVTFCGQLCAWAHTVAILIKAAIATLAFVALQVKDNIVCRVSRKNTTDWLAYMIHFTAITLCLSGRAIKCFRKIHGEGGGTLLSVSISHIMLHMIDLSCMKLSLIYNRLWTAK